jgi:uncharacterized membrane protein YphA (DoxX/SURF4 family)
MAESTSLTASTMPRPRSMSLLLWALQILLALMFLMVGTLKLSGDPASVAMFDTIGTGQWLRYLTGSLEIAGAIGVLIPLLSGLAGLGLAGVMVGAIATHLFLLGGGLWLPIVLLVMALLVAGGRWPETKALVAKLGG